MLFGSSRNGSSATLFLCPINDLRLDQIRIITAAVGAADDVFPRAMMRSPSVEGGSAYSLS
jgi:hypothetical protein